MRNTNQMGLYWAEFNDAWQARLRCGGRPASREAWRKQLHVRAGCVDRAGQPKSSKAFTNLDLDRFVGVCRAWYKGGDLQAQLDIEEQPIRRALAACEVFLAAMEVGEEARGAYVAGVYRNLQRKRVREGARELFMHEMPDEDLGLVVAAIKHTWEHKCGQGHGHPRTPYASRGERKASTHHVGARHMINVTPGDAAESRAEPAYTPPDDQPF